MISNCPSGSPISKPAEGAAKYFNLAYSDRFGAMKL